jgi:hypothetical protein
MIKAFGVDLPSLLKRILISHSELLKVLLKKLIIGYLPGFIHLVRYNKKYSEDQIPWNSMKQQLSDCFFLYWLVIAPMKYMPKTVSRVWVLIMRMGR